MWTVQSVKQKATQSHELILYSKYSLIDVPTTWHANYMRWIAQSKKIGEMANRRFDDRPLCIAFRFKTCLFSLSRMSRFSSPLILSMHFLLSLAISSLFVIIIIKRHRVIFITKGWDWHRNQCSTTPQSSLIYSQKSRTL